MLVVIGYGNTFEALEIEIRAAKFQDGEARIRKRLRVFLGSNWPLTLIWIELLSVELANQLFDILC